jgi:hypothetical protein
MATLTLGDKAARVLKMLIGMRNARVAAAMAAYGLTDADLQEGWTLLQAVSRDRLGNGIAKPASSELIDKLDVWENRWFPIAVAALERRFPAVSAQVFKNLAQTSGTAVVVSVQTFVERFDQMAASVGSYGPEGAAATAVLAARGLTGAVVDEARALLETVGRIETYPDVTTIEEDQNALAKAEADLWAWYLEWSSIARIAVKQRVLLKQMGFAQTHTKAPDEVVVNTVNVAAPQTSAAPVANSIEIHH